MQVKSAMRVSWITSYVVFASAAIGGADNTLNFLKIKKQPVGCSYKDR